MSKTIKKDFFAPLASGLGAMRRAAMMLLVMMLTTMTAWAQEQDPFGEYQPGEGMGDLTISTPGQYPAFGEIQGNLIIDTEDEVILDVYDLNVQEIELKNGKLTLNVHSNSEITAEGITVTTLNMDGGTINCDDIDFQSGTVSGGTIHSTNAIHAAGSITGGTLTADDVFTAGGRNDTFWYLTISGGNISAPTIDILTETTINVTDPNFSIAADDYQSSWYSELTIIGRSLIDEDGNVYAADELVDLFAIVKTLKPAYSVAFDENGGSTVTDLTVAGGSTISAPVTTRDGYSLEGWYNGTNAYDFSATVTDDLALTAHWKEKKQLSNSDITVSAIADQTYTGSAIEPAVTVKDGETDITTECDIVITNNTNVGTANVAITAKSESVDYSGSTSTTFTIVPRETDYGCLTYTETGDAATSTIELNGNSTTDLALTASVTGQTTLNRSFTKGTKVTLCLPFAVTADQKNALGTFYQFAGLKEGTTDVVKMQALDNSADLEANKAYILDPKADIAAPIDFGQQTIAASPTVVASTSGTNNEFTFQGTYSLITWDENHTDLGKVYCFVGLATDGYQLGEFAKVGRNTTCKPFRAYLKYTGEGDLADAQAAVRGANGKGGLPDTIAIEWISATGTTTGVSTVRVERIDGDWYSFDGRKLNGEPTKKGIYIYKGKKVIK